MSNSPSSWDLVILDDLLEPGSLTYGIVQPGQHDADGVPIVRVKDLEGGRVNTETPLRVSVDIERSYQRSRVQPADVLLSLVGSVGTCAVAGPELDGWNLARAVALVRPRHGVDPRWIAYCLRGPEAQAAIRTVVNTTVQTTLNLRDLRNVPVPLPPSAERDAITGVLGALDDKIESNRRRAEIAESLLDMLAIAAAGPDRVPLGELVQVDRASCTPASLGGTLVDHFSLPAFDAVRLPHRTPGESIKSNKLVIASESVLVSRLNPGTNRTWFTVPEPGVMAAASTEFIVMRPGSGVGLGGLWLAVRDEFFQSELTRRATGTSGSHQRVRPDDALSIEVPDVRGLDAAQDAEAEGLLRLVHQARTESSTLADLRDALLPELLSGRLRVPLAEDLVGAAT